jgi:hypothetical protein
LVIRDNLKKIYTEKNYQLKFATTTTRWMALQPNVDNSTALLKLAADLVAISYNYGNRLAATPVAIFGRHI